MDIKMTESYITLNDLRFHAYHGVMPQERLVGNDYLLTLRIGYDISRAMVSDDVADTLNYAEVYQAVKAEMDIPSSLLEHVAARIGRKLFETFPCILSVTIQLMKRNPPMGACCEGASVELHLINNKT